MKTTTDFMPMSDRYRFDLGECSYDKGFAQIDTDQDASYYGQWVSPTERKIVAFVEGDVTVREAADDTELVAALRELKEWNECSGYSFGIDPGFGADMRAAFDRLGAADLLH